MTTLLRVLGVDLLALVAPQLPRPVARFAGPVVLVLANLLPIWAVLRGSIGMGDVFLTYWWENVVVGVTSVIRIATAAGDLEPGEREPELRVNGRVVDPDARGLAQFFALHYGIFTLVHGIFTVVMVAIVGLTGSWWQVLLLCLAITASHVLSLGLDWFGQGERFTITPGRAMWQPYPRMLALHVAVIGGFALVLGGVDDADGSWTSRMGDVDREVTAVALLCGLKLCVDLGFLVWQQRRSRRLLAAT